MVCLVDEFHSRLMFIVKIEANFQYFYIRVKALTEPLFVLNCCSASSAKQRPTVNAVTTPIDTLKCMQYLYNSY